MISFCSEFEARKREGRSAKHQSARIDYKDVVDFLSAVYVNCAGTEKLWPWSAATLRGRSNCLLKALDLPVTKVSGQRPFDFGSLRPGGATFLLNLTEDGFQPESWNVMDIYLQEVHIATCVQKLLDSQRSKIQTLVDCFQPTLELAIFYLRNGIPPKTWLHLMKS